jgi:aspartate kinase
MAGVTNELIAIAEQASKSHLIGAVSGVEGLRDRHLAEVDKLVREERARAEIASELSAMFDELAHLAEALSVLGDLSPRSHDAIASMGEQLSSLLAVAAFADMGLAAVHVDARHVVLTDNAFTKAEPRPDAINEAARRLLLPPLREGRVPVLGGYIGSAPNGVTTTLGRGGSDYSASLIGAALQVEAIEIWTDVDGMLTADPRVVEGARLIDRIRFEEASELASFGAKVLHPSTIAPAVRLGIPVFVYNSRRPEGAGTMITFEAPRCAVRAIAGKGAITLLQVRTPRMLLTHGFLRTFFELFERHRTSVDVVATSEVSITVTIDDAERLEALVADLRELGDVVVERNRGVLAVVGAGIGDNGRTMARALGALDDMRVHLLSLSATGINLTAVVDGDRVAPGMKRLHAEFFGAGAAT